LASRNAPYSISMRRIVDSSSIRCTRCSSVCCACAAAGATSSAPRRSTEASWPFLSLAPVRFLSARAAPSRDAARNLRPELPTPFAGARPPEQEPWGDRGLGGHVRLYRINKVTEPGGMVLKKHDVLASFRRGSAQTAERAPTAGVRRAARRRACRLDRRRRDVGRSPALAQASGAAPGLSRAS
jgi:hypothetical protein